jgi:hypothetical protein
MLSSLLSSSSLVLPVQPAGCRTGERRRRTGERRRSGASCPRPAGPRTAVRHVRWCMYEHALLRTFCPNCHLFSPFLFDISSSVKIWPSWNAQLDCREILIFPCTCLPLPGCWTLTPRCSKSRVVNAILSISSTTFVTRSLLKGLVSLFIGSSNLQVIFPRACKGWLDYKYLNENWYSPSFDRNKA